MDKNKIRLTKSGTGRGDSAQCRTADRRKWMFMAGFVLIMLAMTAGFGCLRTYAGTSDQHTKTVVIKTDSDEEFASESSKLAKKSRGLTVNSTGEAKAYSSGRLIVGVEEGKTIDFSRYNAETVIESNFGVYLVQFSSGSQAKKAAKKIAALSGVSYVEPDDCSVNLGDSKVEHVSIEGSTPYENGEDQFIESPSSSDDDKLGTISAKKPDTNLSEDQIYEQTVYTEAAATAQNAMSWGAAYIQADKYAAFVKAHTKKSIKVAIVDSGVSYHVKLKGRILTGKDYVDNDSNPSDKNGHGTHVAGVIVDCTPGINVKILPIRVINASGNGNPSAVGNGIRYAVKKGAKVINLSLGAYRHYKYIEQCITYAHNKGVTVVVAAGNESSNTKYVCPAHMTSPIVVGAINSKGKRAYFSNYGSSLDISAPGVGIRSCWLKGQYATASGTSMAAPHISAVAAMYRLMNPSIKAGKTAHLVRCYARDLGAKGTDKYYGRGVPRMTGAITPSKVTLSQTKLTLQVKKSVKLKATIAPYYAGKNKLTWKSSNKKVVTVSGGKLVAKKKGTATITVKTVNGKKATCKVTVTNAKVTTSSAGKITVDSNKSTSASQAAQTVTASASSKSVSQESTVSTQSAGTEITVAAKSVSVQDSASAAAAQQEMKIYIYPSEETGNAPIQDGSIVAGSRLALDAEIVSAGAGSADLQWESSDPGIAEVDENGIVTAVSAGEAQITAAIPSVGSSTAADENASSAQKADTAAGTYTVKVVKPSILTRHASYSAGEEESEVKIDAVVRVPASLDDTGGDSAGRINPAADYVLAVLNKDDKDCILLGAVNLGSDDSGTVRLYDAETGEKRTDVKAVREESKDILADLSAGKQKCETGILSMSSMKADGSKADLVLKADIDALRAAASEGPARTEKFSECVIAVYTDAAFTEREKAAEDRDMEKIREIDEKAICMDDFSLSFDVPEKEAAETAAPADGTGDGGANTGSQTQKDSGKKSNDSSSDSEKNTEDAADQKEAADSADTGQNNVSSSEEKAASEESDDQKTSNGESADETEKTAEQEKSETQDSSEEKDVSETSAEKTAQKESGTEGSSNEDAVTQQPVSQEQGEGNSQQTEESAVNSSTGSLETEAETE